MGKSPVIDLVLRKSEGRYWSEQQRDRLCEGVRDSEAPTVVIELKYTESVNIHVLKMAMGCDEYYCQSHDLKPDEMDLFVVSSKTPTGPIIDRAQYKAVIPGVLRSPLPGYEDVPIISLNDLSDAPHNTLFKLFASKYKQKVIAFANIVKVAPPWGLHDLEKLIGGMCKIMLEKEVGMVPEVTTEDVKMVGGLIGEMLIGAMSPQKRMEGLSTGERVEGLSTGEVMEHLSTGEVMEHFSTDEVMEHLSTDEVMEHFSTEELERFLARRKSESQAG
jgi:hypothetical protein